MFKPEMCPFCSTIPFVRGPIVACIDDSCPLEKGYPQRKREDWNLHARAWNGLLADSYVNFYSIGARGSKGYKPKLAKK